MHKVVKGLLGGLGCLLLAALVMAAVEGLGWGEFMPGVGTSIGMIIMVFASMLLGMLFAVGMDLTRTDMGFKERKSGAASTRAKRSKSK